MLRFFPFLLLISFILFPSQEAMAQDTQDTFETLSDSILALESASYRNFDQLLTPFSNDPSLLRELIEKSDRSGNALGKSYAYNQLGKLNATRFNYLEAIEFHEEALRTARENGQTILQMTALNLLGSTALRMDSIKNALEYHQKVLSLASAEKIKNEEIQLEEGKAYYGIGNIYRVLGHWELAISYLMNSLSSYEGLNYPEGEAYAYNKIGEILEALGRLDEAVQHYQKSEGINENIGEERLRLFNTIGIAHIKVHQNLAEESRDNLEPYLESRFVMEDEELRSLLYTQYGWALTALKEFEASEAYLSKGLELARDNNFTEYQYDANNWLHDLYLEQGDYRQALYFLDAAHKTRSKIVNRRNLQYVYDAVTRFEKEKQAIQMQMMARENEIVTLRLRRNRTTLLIGALLTVLVGLILYIAYRQYQINHEKKIMALEQSRLRSQMNPHFLFNSLNSIKHYIINNEQKNAVLYLNKFSKLIRKILEASSMKENSLKEELETVDLYMNIENIRFDEQIDYQVEIAPDINPQTVRIPSLILQPFLENALWHGLSSKEGEKKIRLEVRQNKKGFINIAIRDNGIGRQASEKLREGKVLKRKSMGISITRERLANFSRIYRNTFDLSIEDLYHGDGSVAGTQVTLKIPTI